MGLYRGLTTALLLANLSLLSWACAPFETTGPSATIKTAENEEGENEPPASFDGVITKIKLINVDSNQTVMEFLQTQTISLNVNQLPTNYSLVAEASSASSQVKSIVFGYGSNPTYRIENGPPFAIAGDVGNRALKWNEPLIAGRNYVISATAFEDANGQGRQGTTLTATLRMNSTSVPNPPVTPPTNPPDPPPTGELSPTIYILGTRGEQAPAAIHLSAIPTSESKGDLDCGSNSVSGTFTIPVQSTGACTDATTTASRSFTKASQIAAAPRKDFECMSGAQRDKLYACLRERDDTFFKDIAQDILKQDSLIHADYEWDFGDPGSRYNRVKGFNASHLYMNPGTYTIRLKVRNAAGQRGEDTMVVVIKSNSQAHSVHGTRPVIYASSQGGGNRSGSDEANPIRFSEITQPITNKVVYLKRGEDYSVGAGVRVGSNTVLAAYGDTSLRRPKLIYNKPDGEHQNFFILERSPRSILIKDLEITSASSSIRPRGITLQGSGFTTAQDISLVGLKIGRVSVFATSDNYPTGVMLMDNVSQLNADLSRNIKDNFMYAHGRGIFAAGNVIKTKIPENIVEGEPLFRVCGMGSELINLFNNDFFTDVPRKDNVVTIRDGHAFSVIGNRLQHGNIDIQADCIGKDWLKNPLNERTTNLIFDGNRIENANIVVKDSVKSLMLRNNVFHQRKLEANYPSRRNTSIEIKGGTDNRHGALEVSMLNNTAVLSRDNTTFLKVWTSTPNTIEFINNLFFTEIANVKPIDFEFSFAEKGVKVFRRLRNNIFVTPSSLGKVFVFNDGGKTVGDINGQATGSSNPAGENRRYDVGVRTEIPVEGTTNARFQPTADSDFETDGLNLKSLGIDYDGAGRVRPASSSTWTPGALLKQGSGLGSYPFNQFLDP